MDRIVFLDMGARRRVLKNGDFLTAISLDSRRIPRHLENMLLELISVISLVVLHRAVLAAPSTSPDLATAMVGSPGQRTSLGD